ncbi:aminoglycoside phosphotransferase family protein [Bacillus spongiae]|uniref:Aminoglycoside phosphotransferase family protein n=1 Tax=Bacillus spongiae TaxID=2683610 RepID=A0ABU8HE28_9BACI
MKKLQQVLNQFKLNVLSVDDVPQSFSSTVYKLTLLDGRTVYLKIPYSREKLQREYAALTRLYHEFPVPQVLDYWEGNDDFTGALLLSTIQGVPLTGKVDTKLAYDIGVYHARLHEVVPNELDATSPVENVYDDWSSFVESKFYFFANEVKEMIHPRLYEQSLHYFNHHMKSLSSPDGPCFIHLDFRPGNIIVHENQVAGIIDFESVRIGATEMDFTKLNRDIFMKYPGTIEAYQQGYQSIRPLLDLQTILPFYRFYDAFNSIGWGKKRSFEKHRAFVEENMSILKTILVGFR